MIGTVSSMNIHQRVLPEMQEDDGVALGCKEAFLHKLIPTVLEAMKKPYPYLVERRKTIEQVIKTEEAKFLETLDKGNEILSEKIRVLKKANTDVLADALDRAVRLAPRGKRVAVDLGHLSQDAD